MRLREVADILEGTLYGPDDIEITSVCSIEEAEEGSITFLTNRNLIEKLRGSRASAVIVSEYLEDLPIPQIVVKDPRYAFAQILRHLYVRPHPPKGVMEGAYVSPTASLGRDITLYPNVYVSDGVRIGDRSVLYPGVYIGEGSTIGEDCLIYPNVTIREGVRIGSRVTVHSGTVIGSDGFGYVMHEGRHEKIPQVGGVVIEDDVEIGACVTIDRATTGNTVIGEGTKIDNLVQIGHNVKIGKHCIIVAQVGIAGSTELGNYVTLAGQVGISDHLKIGDGCIVGAKSGVMRNLTRGAYSGIPATEHRKWLKTQAIIERLPDIYKKIRELERELEKLKSGGGDG